MSLKQRASKQIASVIARYVFAPETPIMFQISNAQVMTEGVESNEPLPNIGDIVDLRWIKDVDEQAEYEIGKNLLSTNGEVTKVEKLPDFYLVTVKLLPLR